MPTVGRVTFAPVDGAADLFTPAFCDYLLHMHDAFAPRVAAAREARTGAARSARRDLRLPASPARTAITDEPWQVPPVPEELRKPGIEITGPVSITSMFINALNPGPEGSRAEGDLDDDEDSAGHRLVDTVRAAHNRTLAVRRELAYHDAERDRDYAVQDGALVPLFITLAVYGAFTHSRMTLTQALVADSVTDEQLDAAFSIFCPIGFVSAPFWALVTGAMMEFFGFTTAFSVLALSYLGGVVLMFWVKDAPKVPATA